MTGRPRKGTPVPGLLMGASKEGDEDVVLGGLPGEDLRGALTLPCRGAEVTEMGAPQP